MMASAMMRAAAAPSPCRMRAATISSSEGAIIAISAPVI